MTDFARLVAIPPPQDINGGMTAVTSGAMLAKFGVPGRSDPGCGEVTNTRLERRMVTKWVGPFRVEGLDVAVEKLHQAFLNLRDRDGNGELFEQLKTAGMLCVRLRRGSNSLWSNHSWGTAVDLYCGDEVVAQGSHECHAGILAFYGCLHEQGFYWGAEFSGKSIDGMHFELSAEEIAKIDF